EEHVHALARGDHVIQTAVADVVAPAVAADDPHALLDERVRDRCELARFEAAAGEQRLESYHPVALSVDPGFGGLIALHELPREIAERSAEAEQQMARVGGLCVQSHAHSQAELGVVLEERVRPRWTSTVTVERPRRRRLASAVDRRAPSRVRDEGSIPEELTHELEIGCFAAAGASARELEERLEKLDILYLTGTELVSVGLGQAEEEGPVPRFRLAQGRLRRHVNGPVTNLALALGRASL